MARRRTGTSLTAFARESHTGALRQLPARAGCIRASGGRCALGRGLANVVSVTISPDGRNAYAAASLASDTVSVFARDPASGELRQLPGRAGCFTATTVTGCARARGVHAAVKVVVDPTGSSVYVTSFESNAVALFRREAASGRLRQPAGRAGCVSLRRDEGCATTPGLANAIGLAVAPDGGTVYVTGPPQNAVVTFARNAGSGRLTPQSCNAVEIRGCTDARALAYAYEIVVSPDGRNVYVTSIDDDAIAVFARG